MDGITKTKDSLYNVTDWRSTELDYIEHLFVEKAEQTDKYEVYTDRTKSTVPYDDATISDCLETIKQGIGYAQKLGCMAFNLSDTATQVDNTPIKTEPPIQKQTNISFSDFVPIP